MSTDCLVIGGARYPIRGIESSEFTGVCLLSVLSALFTEKKIFGLPRLSPHSYSASLLSAAMLPRLRTTSYRPVSEHLFLVALRTDSDSPLLSLGPCGLSRRVLARSDLSQSHDTLLVRRYRLRSVQPRLQCQGVPVKRVRRRRP